MDDGKLAQARAIVAAGYRALAKMVHPDAGGSHEAMIALTDARDLLDGLLGGGVPAPQSRVRRAPGTARYREDEYCVLEDVEVLAETDKAILCLIDEDEYWIPLSQIHDDSEVWQLGTKGDLVVTRWLARKKGLRGYPW